MIQLAVVAGYLVLLLGLGLFSNRLFRGTSRDYMLASQTIGPFLLMLSIFGTTMTAFALVGSTGEAFVRGIGVYGLMASSSGIVHSLCFFLLGVRLWSLGRKYGYITQVQFFRDRLESDRFGLLLFAVLVALVVPYLLIGVLGAGKVIHGVTQGAFPDVFEGGAVPEPLASLFICCVVLTYVFFGGMRGTAWANAFQTLVFMVLGVVTFGTISGQLGGWEAASRAVLEARPEALSHERIDRLSFFTYLLIPLSVGMFPHVFQHWLTARSAATFKWPIVLHPVFILIVWAPCVLLGVWATAAAVDGTLLFPPEVTSAPGFKADQVLPALVDRLTSPLLAGFLTAGLLAAIMSSLDSQFLCLGTIFTEDVVLHYGGRDRFTERQTVLLARLFIVAIVAVTYAVSLLDPPAVFPLGVWCFSGFSGLFPLVFAALYWKRLTRAGGFASVLAMAGLWVYLFQDADYGAARGYTFHGIPPVAVIVSGAAAALILVSLVSRPPSPSTLARFFPPRGD